MESKFMCLIGFVLGLVFFIAGFVFVDYILGIIVGGLAWSGFVYIWGDSTFLKGYKEAKENE